MCSIKHFDEPSEFGINEGRISKMEIRKGGKIHYAYERGLIVEDMDEGTKSVYDRLLAMYN